MEPQEEKPDKGDTRPLPESRTLRLWPALLLVVGVLWVIADTERRGATLRAQGFGDVAITSLRNHAYFPLIGGLIGALVSVALYRGILRLRRGKS